MELNAVGRCMDYVREKTCSGREDMLVSLLANLTSLEAAAETLLQVQHSPEGMRRLHAGQACCGQPVAPARVL